MSQFTPQSLAQGRYTVGPVIGHGGMAEVHIGTDTRLGRQVAIKILRPNLANDQVFLARFRKEARSVAQLNNPNIVSIYDTGEEEAEGPDGEKEKIPYIIMEYVKGQTLREIIRENGALSPTDAGQIIIGILNALEYSHKMGIIHRDIKPSNVMVSEQGVVKVMDFGIARALDDSATTMTQSQGVVGTAQYLSPEQAKGENIDMRSDLYSAGCVLYEMLTGRPPFSGDSPVAIAYQHVSQVATPPSSIIPGLPKIWDSVVAKAMTKDRQNRYSTAAEFKRDVQAILSGQKASVEDYNPLSDLHKPSQDAEKTQVALPPSSVPPSGYSSSPDYDRPFGAGRAVVKKKHKAWIVWLIVCILAACCGAGAWIYFSTRPQYVTVPSIQNGMTEQQAEQSLSSVGLKFQAELDTATDQPKGNIIKQDPASGQSVIKGSTVTVWFSAGPATAQIPNVVGMTEQQAEQSLSVSGFSVGSVEVQNSPTIPKDRVTGTSPAAGSSQSEGTKVTLYISSGQTTVPNLVGKSEGDAQTTLSQDGFNISIKQVSSTSVAKGMVVNTSPAAGSVVSQGATITLNVSEGPQKVTIPSQLRGEALSVVKNALQALGLKVKLVPQNAQESWTVENLQAPSGESLSTSGGSVDSGSTITVYCQSPSSSSSSTKSSSSTSQPSSQDKSSSSSSSANSSSSSKSN
ncbi:MAG: Stk1 family PASTA domain-containing Ser/Thr kinase [Aeriscardovia sp.]|nr:Stk1 family PASTA domain-containing Ser/Thr kinase [Aeriscardovia sp.]